jgi:hypothetical protein
MPEKNNNNNFWLLDAGKEREKNVRFQFSIPKFPKFPELRGLHRRSREKKKFFLA